jgi:hypothetical protein
MPVQRLRMRFNGVAVDRTFDLAYLVNVGHGSASYIQYARTGTLPNGENSPVAETYWAELPSLRTQLANLVRNHLGIDADPAAILRAPSGRTLHCPFFGGIHALYGGAENISNHITKGNVNSGGQDVIFNAVLAAYHVANLPLPHLPATPTIIVVDDVFNCGKTIAAIMERLAPYVPEDTSYVLACPLKVPIAANVLVGLGIEHEEV